MTSNTSTSFEILKVYPSRVKLLSFFIFALFVLYFFLFSSEFNVTELGDKGSSTRVSLYIEILKAYGLDLPFRIVIFILGIMLFGFMSIYAPFLMIRNRPMVIATEEGLIADQVLNRNLIPWDKIDRFRIIKSKIQKTVEVVMVEGYQTPKNHSWLRKIFGVARDRHQINTTFSNTTSDELIVELTERLELVRGIPHSGNQLKKRALISQFAFYRIFPKMLFFLSLGANSIIFITVLLEKNLDKKRAAADLFSSTPLLEIVGVLYLLCIVSWFYFIYRANVIANLLGEKEHTKLSPYREIGWYFVPFLNFIKPLRNVLNVWKMSGGSGPERIFYIWWAMFLIFYVCEVFFILGIEYIGEITGNENIELNLLALLNGVGAISIYIAIKVIDKVCDVQKYGALDYD